jgi:hypothetical protein
MDAKGFIDGKLFGSRGEAGLGKVDPSGAAANSELVVPDDTPAN